jgi:3-oxoacyl-[acyl-carrier-protein] synthase II
LALQEKGPRHGISPYFVPAIIVNLAAGQISIRHGCKGPNLSHVSACSTGAHSIGEAFRTIDPRRRRRDDRRRHRVHVTPLGIGGFCSSRALSTRNDAPTKASRPFSALARRLRAQRGLRDPRARGARPRRARGARILGEIVGYGLTGDAYHITMPPPGGEGAQRCMRMALRDAASKPEQIGYINAHGTSTGADAIETQAIRAVFGAHADRLAVSSTKSMHGHLLGAAGGLEAAISILALRDGILPPTINLDDPDPACDLDYVPHVARRAQVEYAMSNSFGFGGTNACLVFRKAEN